MVRFLLVLLGVLRSACRIRADLVLENAALRHQLGVLMRNGRRPRVTTADRWFWILLRRFWSRWSKVLMFVKPETVVRWHRSGFRIYWNWCSRRRRTGRPSAAAEVRALVRRLATENPTRGAPRVHGELRMLGFEISERTVSRLMPRASRRDAGQRWMTFLRNHRDAIAAMDFFVVPTVTFQILYVWFMIEHGRRRIVHFHVTDKPNTMWVVQQLREAFPLDTAPGYLLFDRDAIYSAHLVSTLTSFGTRPTRTAPQSPWQNGVAERWIGSVRRELLDHVIVLDDRHLLRLLWDYVAYHHDDRTHLGLAKATPANRPVQTRPEGPAKVVALPRLGGLHHRYQWHSAA